jgi:hypothetical protein
VFIVTEFTVMPPPEKLTEETPDPKFDPRIVRSKVLPMAALVGEILVIIGAGSGEAAVHEENELTPVKVTVRDPGSATPPMFVHVEPPGVL